MDQLLNPYSPGAGATPVTIAGRDEQIDAFRFLLARLAKGRTAQSLIITGLRGVGKTVLLSQFRDIAFENDWVVLEIEASKHDDFQFKQQFFFKLREALFELAPPSKWTGKLKRAASILKSFSLTINPDGGVSFGADIEPLIGKADTHELSTDLTEVFIALGEAAKEKKRGVVLLIDELQFLSSSQLEAIIAALHKTVQRNLPFTLVGAGLPQIAELAGDAKSYAERLFTFIEIGSLDESNARKALEGPAEEEGAQFEDQALTRAVAVTEGYPYFLQELGWSVWQQAAQSPFSEDDVTNAIPRYEAKLDSSFFRVRLDRCTELQKAYLRAMAELGRGPQSASDVAAVMGRETGNVAPVRAQLIEMGLLYTPSFGQAAYTVPQFAEFVVRAEPTLHVPEKRVRRKKSQPDAE
ncbi:ATP-binding protein [Corynebacterium phoceense]|uniref:ATP-binding protein n=1 Tax=Corynebacterium phoceense TaxID=1686286 RepID=UPI0034CD07FB